MARMEITKKQISVAIPVYKPHLEFLEETIKSIVNCGIDNEALDVVIIDSTDDKLVLNSIVRRYPFIRHIQNKNMGIARDWNRCIELASCDWIHILHADDLVLPGFYEELLRTQAQSNISVFASRLFYINELGNITSISHLEQQTPGFLKDAPSRIVETNTIQCPSIVVRKDVYKQIGGFNPELRYVLDWEMWFRISLHYPIWYVPKPLACFRLHSMSETPRVKESGESARDIIRGVSIISEYAPSFAIKAREYGARKIVDTAIEFLIVRRWKEAATQLRLAPLCLPTIVWRQQYMRCWIWLLRIVSKKGFLGILKRN